ncbi:hypothetical protein HDE_12027 [Halotydeus destructor]|nr:hypothetical protein HDE_12027 [Halotydeus destructor]
MRSHISRVHLQSTSKSKDLHKCPECSCVFSKLGSMNNHIVLRHAKPVPALLPDRPLSDKSLEDEGNDRNSYGDNISKAVWK